MFSHVFKDSSSPTYGAMVVPLQTTDYRRSILLSIYRPIYHLIDLVQTPVQSLRQSYSMLLKCGSTLTLCIHLTALYDTTDACAIAHSVAKRMQRVYNR